MMTHNKPQKRAAKLKRRRHIASMNRYNHRGILNIKHDDIEMPGISKVEWLVLFAAAIGGLVIIFVTSIIFMSVIQLIKGDIMF